MPDSVSQPLTSGGPPGSCLLSLGQRGHVVQIWLSPQISYTAVLAVGVGCAGWVGKGVCRGSGLLRI